MSYIRRRGEPGEVEQRSRSLERGHGFGAIPQHDGVRFRVMAPSAGDLQLHLLSGAAAGVYPLAQHGGIFESFVRNAGAGDRYAYTIDGGPLRPDPASRCQPDGVHQPSAIVDAGAYRWRHVDWRGADPRGLAIYELHVGTFTPQGTFAGARERLRYLQELGVTAIELMPIAEFAGTRNWGYDGVCLYAPSHNYGHADDLRTFVDAAHGLGIAVILDVVYNHLGPEGAYLPLFHPGYITSAHDTPWGGAINMDAEGSALVRAFIIDNACHWITEYRIDGLRLDATHALIDDSPTHIVAELTAHVRAAAPHPVLVHAEDHRNLASMLEPREQGGWDLDGVWADDFHHVVRRHLAGDAHGYYQDYAGAAEEIARTLRDGWLYSGQPTRRSGRARGTDASRIPMRKFVVCLQNHDQIGNRAFGDRLNQSITPAAWRAASVLLLTAPTTPLLFMGQEWAASTPFQFFTDLEPDLGRLVTEGRRNEFKDFPAFVDQEARARIPDPQAIDTFAASKLDWNEREKPIHTCTLALYTTLLGLRRTVPALAGSGALTGHAEALDEGTVLVRREEEGRRFWIVARLSGAGEVMANPKGSGVHVVLTTEDPRFTIDPMLPGIETGATELRLRFHRPGAIVLELT
jgi:maltooligosyltrehalose trehalohydrolase